MLRLLQRPLSFDGVVAVTIAVRCRLKDHEHPAAGDGVWGAQQEVPSFLYGMPLQPGRVFLEETCLVTKPALPFAVLKRRLERRLKAMGIKVCMLPINGQAVWLQHESNHFTQVQYSQNPQLSFSRSPGLSFACACAVVQPSDTYGCSHCHASAYPPDSCLCCCVCHLLSLHRAEAAYSD